MMMSTETCSYTDFLTKLYNRSYGIDVINSLIKDDMEFSMFYIDLNKFKVVNDIYGHDVGDLVLQEVGKRFKTLEDKDIIFARFGGDEMICIYQNIDVESINALERKINSVLQEHIIVSESEFSITASMGVARYPVDADNIDDLLKLSDMAMYKAKKSSSDYKYLITDELN